MTAALDPISENVGLYRRNARIEKTQARYIEAARKFRTLQERPPKSVFQRLTMYREIAVALFEHIEILSRLNKQYEQELEQEKAGRARNSYRRWTDEEDAALIDLAARGTSQQELANLFSRTPAAVAARVTHLVGVKRLSYELAATIQGYLDGEEVSGKFVGVARTLSRKSASK